MSDRPSEDDLIARYFAPLAGPGGLGLRDDAAALAPPSGRDLVLTVDALVAGVHFFVDDPPEAIAQKALRVNLSDLAAKGAAPLGFLLTLALPMDWRADWLELFARALGEDAARYACPLLGGDTVSTPGPLSLTITAVGSVPTGCMAPRTGARAGDFLYVSGTIGDAALGLALRTAISPVIASDAKQSPPLTDNGQANELRRFARNDRLGSAFLLDRYLLPQPRLALVPALLAHASGAMDVSDGLVGDLTKMLRVSGVSAVVDTWRAPLSDAAARLVSADSSLLETALTGGDDYEILASVPSSHAASFERAAHECGVDVTRIGEVVAGEAPPMFRDARGAPVHFRRGSFSHF